MKPKYYIYPNKKPEDGEEIITVWENLRGEARGRYVQELDDNRINGDYENGMYIVNWLWRYA